MNGEWGFAPDASESVTVRSTERPPPGGKAKVVEAVPAPSGGAGDDCGSAR